MYNERRNLEFFFNSGSMDGDDIMRQMFHVLTCLAVIDVFGFVSDTGGPNARVGI